MNVEIKQYWENHYKKEIFENVNPKYYYIFPLGNKNGVIILAMSLKVAEAVNNDNTDLSRFDSDELIYLWDGVHNENEILKRIKLVIFL